MKLQRSITILAATAFLAAALVPVALAQSPPSYEPGRATVTRAAPGQTLAAASSASHASVVAGYLRSRGASEATSASLREAGVRTSPSGIVHVRLEQQLGGLTVHGSYVRAAFNARGELVHVIERLAPAPSGALVPPAIGELQALEAAMAHVHPGERAAFRAAGASGNTTTFAGGAFFHSDPAVTRVAVPMADGSVAVGFLVETWSQKGNLLHHTLVSGAGQILEVELRTANDSYNVFTVDPWKGAQTVVAGPGAGNAESPIGWLGAGTQTTIAISGNNAFAYLDVDKNNKPDRGGTAVADGNFLTAADLTLSPSTTGNRAVAVQSLFFHNNVMHDTLYRHGFDEAAGNFQSDNFGKGGAGGDPVQAEAQDGGGTDNANFATPSDGRKPRMQMYLWTSASPTHRVTVGGTTYGAMGADFGPKLTATGLSGPMVTTTPADGCTSIGTSLSGKVALIDRGNCDFTTKAINAQSAGAVVVVIANNQGFDEIFTMGAGANAKKVRIPAVMVSQNAGAALKASMPIAAANVARVDPPPIQIDGSLDTDIVYHEYCHGLTWRMIGGMSGPLAGAIGEGMSDGCAMLINGDDVIGEYAASSANGIRRYPYEGYPLTYGDMTSGEVHDDGEAYAAIVWRMIKDFDSAYPLTGRARLFAYVVDGMNYTPSRPAYEDMRDGILQSVANGTAPSADACLVWQAFAAFGVGVGADGAENPDGTVTISESFALPAGCP